jgi:6-pyruvoyl-tetrahydropterin synthase
MIAHSFSGEVFGPARRLHGATYVVDAEFGREQVDADGIVADIGRVRDTLRALLSRLDYQNLDELAEFTGRNTTTEVLARWVFDGLALRLRAGELGEAAREVSSLRVTLHESHIAWAAYHGDPRSGATR